MRVLRMNVVASDLSQTPSCTPASGHIVIVLTQNLKIRSYLRDLQANDPTFSQLAVALHQVEAP